jgi:hypothetical protein
MEPIRMKTIFRVFKTTPSQIYLLEATGVLPERSWGEVSSAWLQALSGYCKRKHGSLSPEAKKIVKAVCGDSE